MLAVNNLGFNTQKKQLLSEVSFTHQRGALGIIGPNGAGKSTLLKLISGFYSATQGGILWNNRNIQDMSAAERSQTIALVSPREKQPPFAMRTKDYLKLGRAPYQNWKGLWTSEDEAVQERVLVVTGIHKLLEQSLENLSSGEWQRVQLSRALMQEPDLLILDEPTSHLDIGAQIQILKAVVTSRKNQSTLVVLHDLNLAAQYMNQLILLDKGRLIIQGTPREVLTAKRLQQVYHQSWDISLHPVTHKPLILPHF